jgi:tetratricopeptide (TPR) repeat protein
MVMVFLALPGFAQYQAQAVQAQPYWYILEQGKLHFRNAEYGKALLAFEDARRIRAGRFTRMEQDMILVMSLPDVRRLGDDLGLIETYIARQKHSQAAAALDELYYRIPKESFGNSANNVLGELDRLKAYPEAEYWLGETYYAEGELSLALSQYKKALAAWDRLETPAFASEILYKSAEAHRHRQEYQEMEKRLLEVLNGSDTPNGAPRDSLWAGGNQQFTRSSMARIMENDGIGRFLTLYRYDNTRVEKAHRLLGFYCYASNRHILAAEHLRFAFLIQNTILINEIKKRNYDFTFTTLDDITAAVKGRPDIAGWMDEIKYYRTVYYLASSLFASGKIARARELWTFLANSAEAGEWRGRSQTQLQSPYTDRIIEMP